MAPVYQAALWNPLKGRKKAVQTLATENIPFSAIAFEVAQAIKAEYGPVPSDTMSLISTNIDPTGIMGICETLRVSIDTKSMSLNVLVLKALPVIDSEYKVDVIIGGCDLASYKALVDTAESSRIAATQMRKLTAEERKQQEERRREQERQTEARQKQEREAREAQRAQSQSSELPESSRQQQSGN